MIPNVIEMLQTQPNADQSLQLQATAKFQFSMFDAGAEEYSEKEKDRKASGVMAICPLHAPPTNGAK
jgi:hypothetical protein